MFERLKAYAQNVAQPVHCVPDEILSSIFELGALGALNVGSVAPAEGLWARYSLHKTRQSIGAACSYFRNTLLTPRCWSFVACVVAGGRHSGTNLAGLKAPLARPRNCQLDPEVELLGRPGPLHYICLIYHQFMCIQYLYSVGRISRGLPELL